MSRFWYLAVVAAASSCALVSQWFREEPRQEPPPTMSPSARPVPGADAIVAGIAMQDYLRAEASWAQDAGELDLDGGVRPADPDAGLTQDRVDWIRCWLTASNFTAWVELDSGVQPRWRVVVLPTGTCNADSNGGGGEYQIDGESFEILHRELFE